MFLKFIEKCSQLCQDGSANKAVRRLRSYSANNGTLVESIAGLTFQSARIFDPMYSETVWPEMEFDHSSAVESVSFSTTIRVQVRTASDTEEKQRFGRNAGVTSNVSRCRCKCSNPTKTLCCSCLLLCGPQLFCDLWPTFDQKREETVSSSASTRESPSSLECAI